MLLVFYLAILYRLRISQIEDRLPTELVQILPDLVGYRAFRDHALVLFVRRCAQIVIWVTGHASRTVPVQVVARSHDVGHYGASVPPSAGPGLAL